MSKEKEFALVVIGTVLVPSMLAALTFGFMAGTEFKWNAGVVFCFIVALCIAIGTILYARQHFFKPNKFDLSDAADAARRRNLKSTFGAYLFVYEAIEREFLKDPDSTKNDAIQTKYFLEVNGILNDEYGKGEAGQFKIADSGTIESAMPVSFSPANRKMLRQIRGRKEMLGRLIDDLKKQM